MFERFTDRARRVLVLAQDEAKLLQHGYIGTEHILLGLIDEGEGVAARALQGLDIAPEAVREAVLSLVTVGLGPDAGAPPFTPRAKKVLELSLREALQLGHNYIGTEHILLGLVREGEGIGCQALTGLGAELTTVRQQVIGLLDDYQQGHEPVRVPLEEGASAALRVWSTAGPDGFVRAIEQAGRRPDDYRIAFDALGRWLAERGRSIDGLGSDDLLVESTGEGPSAGLRLSVRRRFLEA